MKIFNLPSSRVLAIVAATAFGLGAVPLAHAGEKSALKVFVRWNAFTPQVLAPSATLSTRSLQSRIRLQLQLQHVVPGAWVGRTFQHVGWSVVAIPVEQKATAFAKLQSAFGAGNVEAVHSRRLYKTPNDPDFSSQWWLPKIGAPTAWDTSTGSSSVIVAVVDTGASLSHPDLVGQIWKNSGEIPNNGRDDDGDGYVDDVNGFNATNPGTAPEDDSDVSHGTHVSGIIGARGNNAKLVSGVNWNVTILPVKVFDAMGYSDDPTIAAGLDYVLALKARGINIRATNDSWGGDQTSTVLSDAFSRLNDAGILNFVAAGNGDLNQGVGYSLDVSSKYVDYPSSYTFPTIVSVGASDENDAPAGFSNYGPKTVDIFAPGTDILSLARGGGTEYLDGTSMATPVVTGAAALLWSIKPDLSAAQMKALLLSSSFKAPALQGQCVSNGRLDLAVAVSSLVGSPTPTPKPTATPAPTATPKPTATPVLTATPKPAPTATPVPAGPFSLTGYTYFKQNGVTHPLAGAAVYLNRRLITTSNARGVYLISGLAAGNYTLGAHLSGYSFGSASALLSGSGARVRRDIVATAPTTRYFIAGTTRNAGGTAVSNVQILLNNQAVPVATSNSSGRFLIQDRARGTHSLSATINGTVVVVRVALPSSTGTSAPNADVVLQPRATSSSPPGGSGGRS